MEGNIDGPATSVREDCRAVCAISKVNAAKSASAVRRAVCRQVGQVQFCGRAVVLAFMSMLLFGCFDRSEGRPTRRPGAYGFLRGRCRRIADTASARVFTP